MPGVFQPQQTRDCEVLQDLLAEHLQRPMRAGRSPAAGETANPPVGRPTNPDTCIEVIDTADLNGLHVLTLPETKAFAETLILGG